MFYTFRNYQVGKVYLLVAHILRGYMKMHWVRGKKKDEKKSKKENTPTQPHRIDMGLNA